jgi:KDO2-lipid IV(A) lauroyltransferase
MAQFILGNRLRDKLDNWPWIQRLIWLLEAIVLGVVLLFIRLMPVAMASRAGGALMQWVGPKLKKNKAFKLNFKTAFPELSFAEREQLVRKAWYSAGQVLAEYVHLKTIRNRRLEIQVHGDSEVFTNPQVPAVFVGAHAANWEMAAAAISRQGIDVAVVYSPFSNPYLDRIMAYSRKALGVGLLARDASPRGMLRQLKQGSIGLVVDQRVDSGTPIPFFGMDKATTLVPARLALSKHCDLIPIKIERTAPARYRVSFYPPVKPTDSAASSEDQAIAMMTQVNDYFEQWIRERPGDWFCSKRRWGKPDKSGAARP